MLLKITAFLGGFMAASAMLGADTPDTPSRKDAPVHCRATIVEIKDAAWSYQTDDGFRKGDVTLTFRYVTPEKAKGSDRCVYVPSRADLTLEGVALKESDIIHFEMSEFLFEDPDLPCELSRLERLQRATKKPNQTLEPTTTAVTDRAGARSAPAAVVAHL
jgi:hypothetical protein